MSCKNKLKEVSEGLARILVPNPDCYKRPDGVYEPTWAPVFYNPRMAFNRDIAVAFARVYKRIMGKKDLIIIEPLAATGIRAIRYAIEANARVYAVDISSEAYKLMKTNIRLNNVSDKIIAERGDANKFMYQLAEQGVKPDIVDIDPFGSPAPFIDAALYLLRKGGVLAVTATDVAPLSGKNLKALRRKYDVIPSRTSWDKEQALRILIGFIARRAGLYDLYVEPLLAYYADYYLRAYILVGRGAIRASDSLEKKLAYAVFCDKCLYTDYIKQPSSAICPYCGAELKVLGPLYVGNLCSTQLISMLLSDVEEHSELQEKNRAKKLLEILSRECEISKPYIRIDKFCSRLKLKMPKRDLVIQHINNLGYKAVKTHFDPRAIKTNAPHSLVTSVLVELAS